MINSYYETNNEFTECDICGKEIESIEDDSSIEEQLLKTSNGYIFCYSCMLEECKDNKRAGQIDLRCTDANGDEYGFCVNCEKLYQLDTLQKEKNIGLLCKDCADMIIEKARNEGKKFSFDDDFLDEDIKDHYDEEEEW